MKFDTTLKALALMSVLILTVYGCKKDKKKDDPQGTAETSANIAVMLNTADGAALQYQQTIQAGSDSLDALLAMGKWLIKQPDVKAAYIVDATLVEIEFTSGMKSFINIIPVDANGNDIFRGGGSGPSAGDDGEKILLKNNIRSTSSDEFTIANKKVLIFGPFNSQFYPGGYPFTSKFTSGKNKLDVTMVANLKAGLSVVNSFKDYGLILINTHGLPEGFLIRTAVEELDNPIEAGSKIYTNELIKNLFIEANGLPIEKFASGELLLLVGLHRTTAGEKFVYSPYVVVTDKYVRNLQHLDNAIVLGNFCYSGWASDGPNVRNMSEAFKSIGAAAYYGYSFPDGSSTKVFNPFAISMEDTLISSLVLQGDSTGVAHLKNNETIIGDKTYHKEEQLDKLAIVENLDRASLVFKARKVPPSEPLLFTHYFSPRYKYGCGTFTDPRDQEEYKLVCIGDQKWFAENLRYAGAGVDYNNNTANRALHGRLYTLTEATGGVSSSANPSGVQGICPQGTHLPSEAEWSQLFAAVGGLTAAETKLRSTEGWAGTNQYTNESGFNMLASGCFEEVFFYKDTSAYFWTATAEGNSFIALNAYPPGLNLSGYSNNSQFNWKFSCRCVVD